MEVLRSATLVAATVAMGLMAGLFAAFSYSVMPGLARTDDRTFGGAMRSINAAILNGWFFVGFVGALAFTVLAAVLQFGRSALPWLVAALVLYGVVLAVTMAVNVPLNDQLVAAADQDRPADLAAVRERFEATWVRWNLVRAVASTAALGCLAWALVVHGRASA